MERALRVKHCEDSSIMGDHGRVFLHRGVISCTYCVTGCITKHRYPVSCCYWSLIVPCGNYPWLQ